MPVTRTYRFHEIFGEEIKGINQRRRRFGRDEIALEIEPHANSRSDSDHSSRMGSPRSGTVREQHSTRTEGEPTLRPTANSHVVGLALSGGGVRSASFCLGALQALDQAGVLKNVDYLSTVSGGGYVGTSLSAAMTHSKGDFPFTSSLTQDEPYPVQHIRNHSNYLFPHGSINTFYNVAIYLRGLLANGLLILPWLLFAAAITIFFKPDSNSLHVSIRGSHLTEAFSADHFGATLIALYVFALLLLACRNRLALDFGVRDCPHCSADYRVLRAAAAGLGRRFQVRQQGRRGPREFCGMAERSGSGIGAVLGGGCIFQSLYRAPT